MAATCIGILVDRGRLDPEHPVAQYWPEFAAAGKGDITVGQALSHQGGLLAVDAPLTFDDAVAVEPVVRAIEAQAPLWEPGTGHGYHALTYGWIAGELVRRVDGRTLGRFLAEEVAGPLGLEMWIGLPAELEARVAPLRNSPPPPPELAAAMAEMMGPGTLAFRCLTLDGAVAGDTASIFNRPDLHASEWPAANGITTARSLARMYAATFGEVVGLRLFSDDQVERSRAERSRGPDKALGIESAFGLGFMVPSELEPMLGPGSYGHPGAGGSVGFAHPESGVAFGYVMNQMQQGLAGDPRAHALIAAVADAVG